MAQWETSLMPLLFVYTNNLCFKADDPWSTPNGNSPAEKTAVLQLIWNQGTQTAHLSIPLLA